MNFAQFNAKLKELQAQTPNVPANELPGFEALMTEYANASTANAVKTEKDKLYGTIEDFKKKNSELTQSNARLTTQVADYNSKFEDLTKKVEGLIPPVTSANYKPGELTPKEVADLNKQQQQGLTPEQVQAMLDKKFQEELPKIIQNSLKPLVDVQSSLHQESVDTYRETRLKELGDTVIPELVTGNNKEEIEASIALSIATRSRYAVPQTITPPITAPITPQVQAPVAPVVAPPSFTQVTSTPPSTSPLDALKGMSGAEFSKNRETLLKELQGLVTK